jgi:hypothetical protein
MPNIYQLAGIWCSCCEYILRGKPRNGKFKEMMMLNPVIKIKEFRNISLSSLGT